MYGILVIFPKHGQTILFLLSLTGKNKQKKIFHFCSIVWVTKFSIISPKGLMLDFAKKI